jgi:hypothetical protein
MHGGASPYSAMSILPHRNAAYSDRHAANNSAVIIPPGWIAMIFFETLGNRTYWRVASHFVIAIR